MPRESQDLPDCGRNTIVHTPADIIQHPLMLLCKFLHTVSLHPAVIHFSIPEPPENCKQKFVFDPDFREFLTSNKFQKFRQDYSQHPKGIWV